jgi:hypothetical protein
MESETTIVPKQETTEVIGLPGAGEGSTSKAVSSMFDKIIEGKSEGKTSKEVVQESATTPPPQKKEVKEVAVKPVEKKPDTQPEVTPKVDEKKEDKKDEEDSRAALRRNQEDKPKEAAPEKKADKTEDEVPEEELQVQPYDKPKTAKRIQALLNKVKTIEATVADTKKQAEEKATKLAELEKKLAEVRTADPATDERVKKQLDELTMYRRRYELDKDPEVKTKYDSRVESAEKSITDILVANKLSDALKKEIEVEGGWLNFSQSGKPIKISDGEGGEKTVTKAELADLMLSALNLGDRKAIESNMLEQVQTKRDRERYFKEQQDTAAEYFKKRDEEAQRSTVEQQKVVEENGKLLKEWHEKTMQADWLKDKEVAANASAAEKAAAEEHNKYNKQLRGILNKAINTHDLPGLMEIVEDSVRYFDERRTSANLRKEVEGLRKELAAKQAEVDKVKKAGSSVSRGGSIAAGASIPDKSASDNRPADISAAFDKIAREGRSAVLSSRDDE